MSIKILGQKITAFGELWSKSLEDLLAEAILGAVENAGLETKQIEAVYAANMCAGLAENQLHLGPLASEILGHKQPGLRVEGACASGSLALLTAEQALLAGDFETVLVVGVEKMSDIQPDLFTKYLAAASNFGTEFGSTFPGLYALLAGAHGEKYGTSRDHLTAVALKNHLHALNNPEAQFHKKFTKEEVDGSGLVASPLRLLDCSPLSDGAAAVVLTTRKVKNKAEILGCGWGSDSLDLSGRESLTSLGATTRAARLAYDRANLEPSQIEVAEVHDCFTIAEIIATEDLGFFAPGQGGPAALNGQTTHGGKIVINPSGGLKACGHPVGATGVKQLAYLAKLIEQDEFKIGLTHNVGGSGATSVVHILGGKL